MSKISSASFRMAVRATAIPKGGLEIKPEGSGIPEIGQCGGNLTPRLPKLTELLFSKRGQFEFKSVTIRAHFSCPAHDDKMLTYLVKSPLKLISFSFYLIFVHLKNGLNGRE